MLRRSGLALFPAFTYFTVGLTARQLWERPQTLAIEDKYINAANQLSVPDDRERNRLSRIIQDTWMSENRPIPIPAGNGKYYLLPMNAFLPQGSLSQNNITSLYLDPMMGGFFKPLIDMAAAISSGNGQAPLTSASGPNARVYNPMDSLPDKVAQTGGFLAQAYMPTPLRTAISIANKLPMAVNPEMAARAADTLDKWQNTDVAQILAKPFGANLYTYDTNGRSARGRSRQIMAQYKSDLQSWQAEFKAAAATGNSGQLQRLVMQRRDMEQNVQQSLNTVWGQ